MLELNIEHQGRELLHSIEVLTRCLQLPATHPSRRRKWADRIRAAKVDLEALYVGGLDRDFRTRPAPAVPVIADRVPGYPRGMRRP